MDAHHVLVGMAKTFCFDKNLFSLELYIGPLPSCLNSKDYVMSIYERNISKELLN